MFALILLALIVVPIVELYVIVQVSGHLGVLETIGLLLVVSIVGGFLVRREGFGLLRRIRRRLGEGQVPSKELVDGALIVFGGALLLTPGFVTDGVGLALLLPPLRFPVRAFIMKRVKVQAQTTSAGFGSFGVAWPPSGSAGDVIDIEEVDLRRTDRPRPGPDAPRPIDRP